MSALGGPKRIVENVYVHLSEIIKEQIKLQRAFLRGREITQHLFAFDDSTEYPFKGTRSLFLFAFFSPRGTRFLIASLPSPEQLLVPRPQPRPLSLWEGLRFAEQDNIGVRRMAEFASADCGHRN